ncbi:TonB-dependent receptor [Methylophaga sp. OBS3]|uniref:TonB-dependent receptor n=1 Tax=Methylophaga sp. OBS3 TaxID=2991934 RepID=UPI002257EC24|nr:TonB-dependent receptor [Methylophaga sp. OBS3]MCX4190205.1 TonB-dependent receptor [Methylophaga sp. OBS3]
MFTQKKLAVLLTAALASLPVFAEAENAEPVSIPSLTVTADPLGARTPDELITPVTVLSGDELNQQRAGTIGETLENVPGVTNSDFGPGVGRPVVRGLQGSRVQMLDDGMRTVDVSGEGGDHAIGLDPSRAEQIEVLRGPATLLYGGNAAGGVVNVKSDRFNPEFGDAPRVKGQMGYGYNGNDRQGNIGLELPVTDNFVLRTDYGLRRNHDFDIDGYQSIGQTEGDKDTLQNSNTSTDSFSLTGLYKNDWGFVGLGYSRWRTDYGIPGVFLGEEHEEQERIHADFDRYDLRSEINDPLPGFRTARIKLSHTKFYQTEWVSEFHDGLLEERDAATSFNNDETSARLELVHDPIGAWQGVIGAEMAYRDFGSAGEGHSHAHDDDDHDDHGGSAHTHGDPSFYVRDNTTKTLSMFVLEERPTDFGRLEFATRLDHVRLDPSDVGEFSIHFDDGAHVHQNEQLGNQVFNAFSVSGGTIIDLDASHHLRLSLSRSERAPSPEQLYAFGSHAASRTFEIGDPNLDKETYTNFEIGLDRHAGDFRFNTNVFYNHVQDYIFLESVDDGTGHVVEAEGSAVVFNRQANARFYGVEFGTAWDAIKGPIPLTLRVAGDYVRGELSGGDNLPRISPARLGVGFDTGYQDWTFSMDYRHVFKQSDSAALETDTDGYNLLSFNAAWSPDMLKGAEVFVQGRNLLNEDGRRHTSFLKDDSPIIGRTIMTGIRFDFGG